MNVIGTEFNELIGKYQEMYEWAGNRSEVEFWRDCKNPSWMLYVAKKRPWATERQIILCVDGINSAAYRYTKGSYIQHNSVYEYGNKWVYEPTKANAIKYAETAFHFASHAIFEHVFFDLDNRYVILQAAYKEMCDHFRKIITNVEEKE